METELGFKPRSSSVISEAPKILKKPKETDPKIRNYMREKKKKSIDNKTNTLIEHISKETKRVAGLKILDVKNQENLQKLKKKGKKTKQLSKNKPKNDTLVIQNPEEKVFEEKNSSDFIFEPDSAMRQGLSCFTEETNEQIKENEEINEKPKENLQNSKETAAILIQYHIRRFLLKKRLRDPESFEKEDLEVKNILTTWQQSLSEIQHQDSYNNILHDQIL